MSGVDFRVREGEVFGLLGPNGAGKTTTIKMITTLLPLTGGTIRVFGVDAAKKPGLVRRFIGYVPQALSPDGTLTGYENLYFIARLIRLPAKDRDRRIREILAMLDLEEAAGRLVRSYSGGMVRKLEIGQAILHSPRVIILDEPTVGLDPVARRGVWNILEGLRATGTTILLTTHSMEEAETLCGRLAIMDRGRIVALGDPAGLKARALRPGATLEEVFAAVTQGRPEMGGNFGELRQMRRRLRRFG